MKAVRSRRLGRLDTLLTDYKTLVGKILSAESAENEAYAEEKAVVDKLELTDTTFKSQVQQYLDEEHRSRLKDIRSMVEIAGQEFNSETESIQKQATSKVYDKASHRLSPAYSRTKQGMISYQNRLKQFVSPSLLADGNKVKAQKITADELIKVNGTSYSPTFYWDKGFMTDGPFIAQCLREYVDFLNGADTPNFSLVGDGTTEFKKRPFQLTPAIVKDNAYVSIEQNDPEVYKTWKARIDSLIEARLLRVKLARLKRNIAFLDRPSRIVIYDLHAADKLPAAAPPTGPLVLTDRFGRDTSPSGIPLLDWDGYLANPAQKITVKTSGSNGQSLNVVLISSTNRVHFDHSPNSPCLLGPTSARKHLVLPPGKKTSEFLVTIWPDRDGKSEDQEIEAYYWFGTEKNVDPKIEIPSNAKVIRVGIKVNDMDSEGSTGMAEVITSVPPFPFVEAPPNAPFLTLPFPFQSREFAIAESDRFTINLDFSHDKTAFFNNDDSGAASRREVFKQAAQDLSYFMKASLGRISRGADSIELADGDGKGSADEALKTANRYAYKDFLIYVRGVPGTTEPAARAGRLLTDDSKSKGRLDKGSVTSGEVLISGVANPETFIVDPQGDQWWRLSWDAGQRVDLYSWATHEQLHAFAFSDAHIAFKSWKNSGHVDSPNVVAYHGRAPVVNERGHLEQEIDVESQRGAFGVIDGNMPAQQWLLTKLDLSLLTAAGYSLKANALWGELTFRDELKSNLVAGHYVNTQIKASSGIPPYYWKLEAGEIPRGLMLDSYTGEISGTPESAGEYHFILSVRDSSNTDTIPLYHYKMMTVVPAEFR